MSTKRIEMLQEQVDAIVIAELQEALELNIDWGSDGCYVPNFELIYGLRTCLQYYMGAGEFSEYSAQLVARQEKRHGRR